MRWMLLGVGAALLGACRDAPTTPSALQQMAGGEEWVAVRVPDEVPTLRTWLAYIRPVTANQRAALQHVRSLEEQAGAARRAGNPARAQAFTRESIRAAVVSLTRNPDPRTLREGLSAVDLWGEKVRREVDLKRFPVLRATAEEVAADHGRAVEALASGDTMSAVFHLASASERIRDHAPNAVALRVLARVEARLRTEQEAGVDHRRALHLLSSARQELLTGDPGRALQRAFYALQLADGKGLRAPAADSADVCLVLPCEPS